MRWTESSIQQALNMHENGKTWNEVADVIGCSPEGARKACARYHGTVDGALHDGYKLVGLWDTHVETRPQIYSGYEAVISDAMWAALEFCKDFQPDEIVLGGDFMGFDAISHFSRNKLIEIEGRRLKHDFDLANKILDVIDSFNPGRKVYLIGNHEVWLDRWIAEQPQTEGLISVEGNLRLKERGYIIVPENKVYRRGHMNLIHGWYYNKYHAAKTVMELGDNVFYGHTHSVQSFTKTNYDRQPIVGTGVGCLCDLNPAYRRNKPNSWVNGLLGAYLDKSGLFTAYNPIIIDGKFWWGGKQYNGTQSKLKGVLHE